MNFSLKCNQIVKLFATNTSACRHFRVCSSSSILRDKEVSDERKQKNKRVSSFLRYKSTDKNLIFKRFSTSPIVAGSRPSSQKESDDKIKDGTKENIPVLPGDEFANLGLFAKFKKMYKEYWYVLVPVHLATSAVWFGTFYYASKSGMDIVAIMQHWNFNETLIKPFRDSSLGHVAVALIMNTSAKKSNSTTKNNLTEKIKKIQQIVRVPQHVEVNIEDCTSSSSDDDEFTAVNASKLNMTIPRRKTPKVQSTRTVLKFRKRTSDCLLKISQENTRKQNEESNLQKRRLFQDSPNPKRIKKPQNEDELKQIECSISIIEDYESDEDSCEIPAPTPDKIPVIEEFEDSSNDTSEVIIPCSNSSENSNYDPEVTISQVSSEQNSQTHEFNVTNVHGFKIKPSGYVAKLLRALSEGQEQNIKWDFETTTPSSQTKYFTVSHVEKICGSMMIFFTMDDERCAIYLDPKDKIVGKLKVGNSFAFLPDYEPYEVEGGVKVFAGLTKIKWIPC
uniref:CSON005550 protein n=1 Tax=Culicoides sonorensis TaxID=179676 RepID=A0A336L7Q2_CULSO